MPFSLEAKAKFIFLISKKSYCHLVLTKTSLRLGTTLPWLWVNAKDVLFYYKAMNEEREDSEPNSTLQK